MAQFKEVSKNFNFCFIFLKIVSFQITIQSRFWTCPLQLHKSGKMSTKHLKLSYLVINYQLFKTFWSFSKKEKKIFFPNRLYENRYMDRAYDWHFLAPNFGTYFRMMLVHLGLPQWQLLFTTAGPTPRAKVSLIEWLTSGINFESYF
jgi:hypothetical protein